MATPDFPGRARLIASLQGTFNAPNFEPAQLQQVLESLYRERLVVLPEALLRADPDHYLRRLVHSDPQRGYQLIAMTWGPGQGAPLHDHGGSWCVDCVWQGELDTVCHELIAEQDGLLRFSAGSPQRACAGTADWLAPPAEYHSVRNPSATHTAVSLHVYPYRDSHCHWFEAVDEHGWHRRHRSELPLAAWE